MTTKKITITRALTELKTLGDRINKMTSEATFCVLQEKPGQLPIGFSSVEELEKRASLQIKFAQQFSDFKDDAIAEVNHVQEKYSNWIEGLYEEQSKLTELSRPFSKELSELKEERLMNQLMEGVELKMSEPTRWSKGRFPELQVKFDWTLRDVKKVKVNRLTASGKSADIEVTQEWKDWGGNVQTATQNIERVRLDNIKSIVRI